MAGAVRTILENDHPDFEVIVLDQSDDALTREALEPFLSDPRVRYLPSASRGRAAGQNAAIHEARGALVLMTDDDCAVPANWLREFEAAFAIDHKVGIVFGNVLPAPHDPATGCIPAYVRQSPFLARGIRDKYRVEGIGACMAVRRSVWRSLGGFDEMLGSGARFRAGEDGRSGRSRPVGGPLDLRNARRPGDAPRAAGMGATAKPYRELLVWDRSNAG